MPLSKRDSLVAEPQRESRVSMRLRCRLVLDGALRADGARSPDGHGTCYLVDLSENGMLISSDSQFKQGAKLNGRLKFERDGRTISLSLRVKSRKGNGYKACGAYSYGMHFYSISSEDRRFLREVYLRERAFLADKRILRD